MKSRNERFVGFYELSVRASRERDALAEISPEIFQKIEEQVIFRRKNSKDFRRKIQDDRIVVVLDDVRVFRDKNCACFLFTVADLDAADAVYRKIPNREQRIFPKGVDEGGASSAHLVVRLTPEPDTFRYPAALEDVEGVPRSRIMPLFEQVFREVCGHVTVLTEDGSRTGDAIFELDSVHRDRLQDAAGRPIGVELVKLRPRATLDPDGDGFTETRRSVVFKIDSDKPVSDALSSLFRIREKQKNDFLDYPLMRVRWKRPDNKTQTLSVDSLADDLLQRAFTRLELISGISPDMPMSTVDIHENFVYKIAERLSLNSIKGS